MAGDVFFSLDRVWSSNSIGFSDLMRRAMRKCRDAEAPLVRAFSKAEDVQCLAMDLLEDPTEQAALTARLLEAAREDLDELRASSVAQLEEVNSVAELVGLAEAHLRDLRDRTTG